MPVFLHSFDFLTKISESALLGNGHTLMVKDLLIGHYVAKI